jgi:hypothetical protein
LKAKRSRAREKPTNSQPTPEDDPVLSANRALSAISALLPGKVKEQKKDERQIKLNYLSSLPVKVIEATRREDATSNARGDAGREDPFAPVTPSYPFPDDRKTDGNAGKNSGRDLGSGPDGLPPPPPPLGGVELPGELQVPHEEESGITFDELPPPPDKPRLATKLALSAVVGDRAILTFKDRRFRQLHGYQKFITLAPGQEFDSVTLVSVDRDRAVLEEEGRRSTVEMAPIR